MPLPQIVLRSQQFYLHCFASWVETSHSEKQKSFLNIFMEILLILCAPGKGFKDSQGSVNHTLRTADIED